MLSRLNPLISGLYATRLSRVAWRRWLDSLAQVVGCDAPSVAIVKAGGPGPVLLCGPQAQSAQARANLHAFGVEIAAGRHCRRQRGRAGWFFEPGTPYGLWLWLEQPLWQRPELQLLWPHLCQWGQVARRPDTASRYLLLPGATAALVCAADGRIRQRNAEAERLLGGETLLPAAIRARVRRLAPGQECGWVALSDAGEPRQMLVRSLEWGGVLLLLRGQEATREFVADDFMALYGLSPKEARVAVELAGGYPPRQVAERLNVGESTVRSHIRQILVKSDSRSLNHLVARLHCGFSGLTCSPLYPVVEDEHAQAQ